MAKRVAKKPTPPQTILLTFLNSGEDNPEQFIADLSQAIIRVAEALVKSGQSATIKKTKTTQCQDSPGT
jgi:hypothetical protein